MRSQTIASGSIAVATVVLGIMAGFFWTYSFNVNLALSAVDLVRVVASELAFLFTVGASVRKIEDAH